MTNITTLWIVHPYMDAASSVYMDVVKSRTTQPETSVKDECSVKEQQLVDSIAYIIVDAVYKEAYQKGHSLPPLQSRWPKYSSIEKQELFTAQWLETNNVQIVDTFMDADVGEAMSLVKKLQVKYAIQIVSD